MVIKDLIYNPREDKNHYVCLINLATNSGFWFDSQEDFYLCKIDEGRKMAIGFIHLSDYFSSNESIFNNSEEIAAFSMLYGEKSYEILLELHKRLNGWEVSKG